MDFLEQPVVHKRFGAGTVKSCDGRAMTVSFVQYGTRTFLYPDVFDGLMKAEAAEFERTVEEALREKRGAERKTIEDQCSALAAARQSAKASAKKPRSTTAKPRATAAKTAKTATAAKKKSVAETAAATAD